MSIINTIFESMASDDDNQGDRLIKRYTWATPDERELIDEVLIMICGYTLLTLIDMTEGEDDDTEV